MLFWTILRLSFKSLLANRMRTVLAMLGIVIGVASVIAMLAVGTGAQKNIMGRLSAMGTNVLILRSGSTGQRGVNTGTNENLKIQDAMAILEKGTGIASVSPVVQGSVQAKYLNKNSRLTVTGCAITYFKIRNFEIEKGRGFTDQETDAVSRVTVLGPTAAENLFGKEDAIGQQVKLNGINFRVIGITKAKGDQGWFSPDEVAFVPFTTAMKQIMGVTYLREINIEVSDEKQSAKVVEDVTKLMRQRHRLQAAQPDDFNIRNQSEIVETASQFATAIKFLLGSIASISLLVGGIGIMNIMLVTVTERTREIGIRKAIGAKNRDILLQFLIESIALSGLGGLVGILFGVAIVMLLSQIGTFPAILEPNAIIIAVTFSIATGIFFGFYPARRAAALNPIECLRYE